MNSSVRISRVNPADWSPGDDERLVAAVNAYASAIEAGHPVSRTAFLREHADLMPELADCLAGLDMVQLAARELPPGSANVNRPAPHAPIGDFQIVRELGRGGMGVVYEAEQLSLGRRVALKVLPFAAALEPAALSRFKNEAQAAAQLQHPHIVPVFAVGADRGIHYYAMQLIDGHSLSVIIHQLRGDHRRASEPLPAAHDSTIAIITADGSTRDELRLARSATALAALRQDRRPRYYRRVAEIGLQVAEALEHAHQRGVIHRDVKPGNLLLDVEGRVWVTDFGLARLQGESNLTVSGDLLGTFRYMSPEQAGGGRVLLDARTDIYSLGVTLYEFATLEPIFADCSRHALLKHIAQDDPERPSAIDPAIPADLETIVLKSIAKSPADRYATAGELAADLRRFLNDQPIRARRPTLVQKIRRWSRRHRGLVASAVALLIVATLCLSVATALIARAQRETQLAYEREQRRASEVDRQRARAEANFAQAQAAIELLTRVGEEDWGDMPQSVNVRRRLLEGALAYYQEVLQAAGDDPAQRAQLQQTGRRVRRLLAEFGELEGYGQVRLQLVLADEPEVLRDLDVTEAQRVVLEEADELLFGFLDDRPQPGAGPRSSEERQEQLREAAAEQEAWLADVLSPGQLRRLQQIARQQRGIFAYLDAEVIDRLKLDENQQAEMIRLIEAERRRGGGLVSFGPHQGPRPSAELQAKVMALLTPDQRQGWNDLFGAPLEVRVGPPRRHRHHGPPSRPHDF